MLRRLNAEAEHSVRSLTSTNRKYTLFIAKRGLLSCVCVKVCVKNNSMSKEIGTEYGNAGIFS